MIERLRKPLDARTMESAINKIRGVYAAQVVIAADNVEEIHVIASPLRKPKQVVRDIESMLLVNFGIRVDYRRVSLVQMQEERLFQAEARPRLVTVHSVDGAERRAEVEMEKDGHLYKGTAQAPAGDTPLNRLVSIATVEAMQQALGDRVSYHIDDVQQISVGPIPAVVVVVTLEFEEGRETLLGICQIRQDVLDAASRATLNALNRRLLIAKPKPGA